MPPQQPDRLLDVIDDLLDFGAHCHSLPFGDAHVAARAALRKPWPSFTRRGRSLRWSMIPKSGHRFSDKIMLSQKPVNRSTP
jgi:hypothetical protein